MLLPFLCVSALCGVSKKQLLILQGVPSGTIFFKVRFKSIVSLGTTKACARCEFDVEAEKRLTRFLEDVSKITKSSRLYVNIGDWEIAS